MRFNIVMATAATFLGLSLSANAQTDVLPMDNIPAINLRTDAAAMALPTGFTPREIFRMFNNKEKNHLTYMEMPANWGDLGWRREGTFGFVSTTQFANSHQLFVCYLSSKDTNWGWKYFSSTDPNCEGWNKVTAFGYFVGYISTVQQQGSVPLYRCYIELNKDHFDTLTSNCEGEKLAKNEGILGYVFQ